MKLSEIKKKYRDILEQSDNDSSSEEFDTNFQEVFNVLQTKNKRAQSASNKENSTSKDKKSLSLHTEIIHLKQRLGQANQKLELKNAQLVNQNQKKDEIKEQKKILERHIESFHQQLQKKDKQLIELKANRMGYQSKLKQLQEKFLDNQLDKQLIKKQINYYQIQQKKFKQLLKDKDNQIKILNAKSKAYLTLQSQNERLKSDIKRLIFLLEDKKVFKSTNSFNKSYLGKSTCEGDSWYNRDSISTVECLFNKHNITDKSMMKDLVKLIDTYKNAHHKKSHSIKQKSRGRRDSLLTNKQISVILPRHTTSSKVGSTSFYESVLYSKTKNRSICKDTIQEQQKIFSCRQVVRQFKTGLDELIQKKLCSRSKLKKLGEWLVTSIDNVIKDELVSFG